MAFSRTQIAIAAGAGGLLVVKDSPMKCAPLRKSARMLSVEPYRWRWRMASRMPERVGAVTQMTRVGPFLGTLDYIAPEQARVVVLKDALGFSFEEISAAADMPVGTAKCYAHRGRSRLRDKLSDVA